MVIYVQQNINLYLYHDVVYPIFLMMLSIEDVPIGFSWLEFLYGESNFVAIRTCLRSSSSNLVETQLGKALQVIDINASPYNLTLQIIRAIYK